MKKRWYHIYVKCHSLERFDVQARSEKEALILYEAGDASLEGDEVQSREVTEVIPA